MKLQKVNLELKEAIMQLGEANLKLRGAIGKLNNVLKKFWNIPWGCRGEVNDTRTGVPA